MGKDVAKVGDDYESCTQQVRAYGCIHPDGSGRNVIIVDTPGFDDTYRFDIDVLRDLAKWLEKTLVYHFNFRLFINLMDVLGIGKRSL